MQDSYVKITPSATVYVGDAVHLMRAKTIQVGIEMYIRTNGRMLMTRTATIGNLLKAATSITHKAYKVRTKTDHAQAVEDLRVWIETLKAALPVEVTP